MSDYNYSGEEFLCGDCGLFFVNIGQWDEEAYEDPREVKESLENLGYISVTDTYIDGNEDCLGCGSAASGSAYKID